MGLINFLVNCTLSDIRPKNIREVSFSQEKKSSALNLISESLGKGLKSGEWESSKKITLRLEDKWESSFVRKFTILPENSQKMKIEIYPSGDFILEFTDGPEKGNVYGIENGKTYSGKDKNFDDSSKLKTYVESLRLYLGICFSLETFQNLLIAGEDDYHHLIFATNGYEPLSKKSDQFLFFISKKSKLIDYIKFTYRDVFSFYKGFLVFENYEAINQKVYPRLIKIQDSIDSERFVHAIYIDKIEIDFE